MSADRTWTPAPRGGLIPLHPLGFATILGRSFGALRGNPRVLLGFAVVVQLVSSIVATLVVGAVAFATLSRLDTVSPYTEEYDLVLAGSVLATALVTIAVALVIGVLGVIVQGVVVGEVAHAALGERTTLGILWRRVRPVLWRLIGYNALLLAAMAFVVVLLVGVVAAQAFAGIAAGAVLVGVLGGIGGIVLYAWLGTKLFTVSSAILLERTGVMEGVRRSWRLTQGRFWPTFGIIVLISVIMNAAASVVGLPFSFAGTALTTVFAPTGAPEPAQVIGFVLSFAASQIVTLIVSSITVVVQATSAALVYLDARMRREGLDLRMQSYIERRDAGEWPLPDPYAFDPEAVAPVRTAWVAPAWGPPYGGGPGQPYGQQQPYGTAPYGTPSYGQGVPPAPPYGVPAPPYGAPVPPYGAPAAAPPAPPSGAVVPPPGAPVPPVPPYGTPVPPPPAPPRERPRDDDPAGGS